MVGYIYFSLCAMNILSASDVPGPEATAAATGGTGRLDFAASCKAAQRAVMRLGTLTDGGWSTLKCLGLVSSHCNLLEMGISLQEHRVSLSLSLTHSLSLSLSLCLSLSKFGAVSVFVFVSACLFL